MDDHGWAEDDLIVFRMDKLFHMLGKVGLPPGLWGKNLDCGGIDCAPLAQQLVELVEEYREH